MQNCSAVAVYTYLPLCLKNIYFELIKIITLMINWTSETPWRLFNSVKTYVAMLLSVFKNYMYCRFEVKIVCKKCYFQNFKIFALRTCNTINSSICQFVSNIYGFDMVVDRITFSLWTNRGDRRRIIMLHIKVAWYRCLID